MQRPQIVKPIPMESLMCIINEKYYAELYKLGKRIHDDDTAHSIALSATVNTTMARKVHVTRKYLNQSN